MSFENSYPHLSIFLKSTTDIAISLCITFIGVVLPSLFIFKSTDDFLVANFDSIFLASILGGGIINFIVAYMRLSSEDKSLLFKGQIRTIIINVLILIFFSFAYYMLIIYFKSIFTEEEFKTIAEGVSKDSNHYFVVVMIWLYSYCLDLYVRLHIYWGKTEDNIRKNRRWGRKKR